LALNISADIPHQSWLLSGFQPMLSINVNAVWAAHNGVSVGLEAHESNAAPGMGLFLVTYPRLIAASVNAAAASDWVPGYRSAQRRTIWPRNAVAISVNGVDFITESASL